MKPISDLLILGIDPAPSKRGNAVVQINIQAGVAHIRPPIQWTHAETRTQLLDLKTSHQYVLLAWDAPLTGPADLNTPGEQDFTQRRLEKVVLQSKPKPPAGISVQGYSGCQHWTISQWLFGLPQVQPNFEPLNDFELVTEDVGGLPERSLVEVHPAVALWQWLKDEYPKNDEDFFCYKKSSRRGIYSQRREKLIQMLATRWRRQLDLEVTDNVIEAAKDSADHFDALIAAVLAYAWAVKDGFVHLVGSRATGAWLLPRTDETKEWARQCNQTSLAKAPAKQP